MSDQSRSSRRSFLKGAGLAGAASLLSSNMVNAALPQKSSHLGSAKNLIFLVADGMGTGTLSLANHWKLRNEQTSLNWMKLYEREGLTASMQDTASASSPVTDSAAAGSAWGSGQRVNNKSINVSVSGELLTPIWTYAKQVGKRTGLVTTCRVTHATPAGFSANVTNRDLEDIISRQYLERQIDVILGGGMRHFHREVPYWDRELAMILPAVNMLPEFEAKDYELVKDREGLSSAVNRGRILGLFSESHIPYAIDRKNQNQLKSVPSLSEMFEAALSNLQHSKDGFVLQVEGGRIDHAGHVNDPAAILHETLEYDSCVPIALEFIEKNPDTLLVITTDHGTGGCQLNGEGDRYADSGPALERINRFRESFESLAKYFFNIGRFEPKRFEEATGLLLTNTQIEAAEVAIRNDILYFEGVLADIAAPQVGPETAVGWTTHNHTSEHVPLLAFGPGSEVIPPLIQNNHLFNYMTQALGLKAV